MSKTEATSVNYLQEDIGKSVGNIKQYEYLGMNNLLKTLPYEALPS